MKKLISLIVSLGLLALIYWKIDFTKLGPVFANCDPWWMAASLGMVVPLTMLTAWRFQQLAPPDARVGFGEANRLILSASVLNLILPSKMGDIAKALFLPMRRSLALSLVVFEKACDMLSLLVWCVFGLAWVWLTNSPALAAFGSAMVFWLLALIVGGSLVFGALMLGSQKFAGLFFGLALKFAPGKLKQKFGKLADSWSEMQGYFWSSKRRFALVTSTSIFIWLLHLLQIWLFILALRAWCPFVANLALSALAILAGLMPLTFAGVGTRDGALVVLYAPYFSAPVALALGLLCTARYVLPAIGGIPFFQRYLAKVREKKATPEVVEGGAV
jgi:glycosyltransferase 2 family protein